MGRESFLIARPENLPPRLRIGLLLAASRSYPSAIPRFAADTSRFTTIRPYPSRLTPHVLVVLYKIEDLKTIESTNLYV